MVQKRKRRPSDPTPVSEIPVSEIFRPKINVLGHHPEIRYLEDRKQLGGCSCGWVSRNRSADGMKSWWKHARLVSTMLIMNGNRSA